ncbi:MAG: NAD(P)H-dependent oxidoreductase [Cytophagaceae bacterium]|nr:NAD(P)H-dependent oxidoreductase [Cytophagaceae bacterium]
MKKILIIDGNPNKDSLGASLADAYIAGLSQSNVEYKRINIRDLKFNPNLQFGYQRRTELEPDLLKAWEQIQWADHLVWLHPLWWGGLPAITKGFIDRLFLPGMAFQYKENSVWWDKLLKGKSGRIICTSDQPYWYYWLINGRPAINQLKKMVLEFCGVSPVKITYLSPVRNSTEVQRKKYLESATKAGYEDSKK